MGLLKNLHLKVMAFFLSLTLYVFVMTDQVADETYIVTLVPDVPPGHILLSDVPEVTVTISGANSAFSRMDSESMQELELRSFQPGDATYQIRDNDFALPIGLTVTEVRPEQFGVSLDRLVEIVVPVLPSTRGQPPAGYELRSRDVSPSRVTITIPDSYSQDIDAIYTRPVELGGRTSSLVETVELVPGNRYVRFGAVSNAQVTAIIEPIISERDVPSVPVWITGAVSDEWQIMPIDTLVELHIRGPQRVVDRLEPTTLFAAIDVTDLELDGQVGLVLTPEIRNLPDDVEVMRIHPAEIRLEVSRNEPLVPIPIPLPLSPFDGSGVPAFDGTGAAPDGSGQPVPQ